MGFSSMDDLINEVTTNGKTDTVVYQKTLSAAATAGYWTDLGVSGGSVAASAFGGTSMTFYPTDDTWSEGAIWTGGDKSTDTKHFLSAGASIYNATGAPWILMAVDMVGYIPITVANYTVATHTATMTAISNTTAKVDRYPNGEGLRMFVTSHTAPTAGGGGLIVNYTNSANTPARATPSATNLAAATAGIITHTGPVAGRYAPFLPLAAGDTGVKDIESIAWSATAYTTGGRLALCLAKPLFTIPIPANGIHTMLDFVNSIPSLRKIPDGANIRFLAFHTGATPSASTVFVNFDYAWG